uniref:Uncharacterized protein n=1 Tax=Physcomitrium patens TaxID=3218 RepID=A0A2K1J160_PHYPA|nr:hypothetical protein PHYPA_023158 [Physcomitrium patens]
MPFVTRVYRVHLKASPQNSNKLTYERDVMLPVEQFSLQNGGGGKEQFARILVPVSDCAAGVIKGSGNPRPNFILLFICKSSLIDCPTWGDLSATCNSISLFCILQFCSHQ